MSPDPERGRASIDGATVLVTGANRGLGKSLVQSFLERGASHVFATVRASHASTFQPPPGAETVVLDVTDDSSVFAAALLCGSVDILVNNAASLANAQCIGANDLAGARLEMETNYWGILRMCRAFAPALAQSGRGGVVNILSIGALAGIPFCGSYCASKAAAWSLTQCVRAEFGRLGISVAAVFAGPILTTMTRSTETAGRCPPDVMAMNIVEALEIGESMIFPDDVSAGVGKLYSQDPWSLEKMYAGRID